MVKIEFEYGTIEPPMDECVVCISRHQYMSCGFCKYLSAMKVAARSEESKYLEKIRKTLEEEEED